jgi:hypothetical protein
MYVYIFEDEVKIKTTEPTEDDVKSVLGGILIVLRYVAEMDRYEELQATGAWSMMPVDD